MIKFANLPAAERQLYFEQTAERMNLPSHLIEKDFWVCFTLKVLFDLDDFKDHLTFKGGTSLSKVYKVIERFSEDIDFAVNRNLLGFGSDNAPDAEGISGEERKRRLASLADACLLRVRDDLYPKLTEAIKHSLFISDEWSLEFKEDESANQVIYFNYPRTLATQTNSYNPPFVRVEMTARTDNHPAEKAIVCPYVADYYGDAFEDANVTVSALLAERTFWEKVTILHQFHYQDNPDGVADGFSRHYYDVFELVAKGVADSAINMSELLPEVADHKRNFYRQAWANYDLARNPKTLELMPHSNIVSTIEDDYRDMREMMFGDTPDFADILQCLAELKQRINAIESKLDGSGNNCEFG